MAVMVLPKQHMCPQCFESLAYTSKDVRKSEQKQPVSYHENGRVIPKTKVTIYWYITCPTCGRHFLAEKFDRYDNA